MPIALTPPGQSQSGRGLTKFTNCRLVKGDSLIWEDLWVSSRSGRIIHSQASLR
jgi:N-acetylglucosamine-6-phosphate deacetylase